MKKNLLIYFILAFFASYAQVEKKYTGNYETDPEWVQAMYSDSPDIFEVVRLYEEYYETHEFIKNSHTQYY